MVNIFILAAGFGERLRPITNHIPKPLLPIMGKPVIEIIIDKLSSIPFKKIGINLHHKAEMLKQWGIKSPYSSDINFFYENPLLGTGGALKNAKGFLYEGPFLVHNSDIISNVDLTLLINTHLSGGNIATIATHNCPKYNNVIIDNNGFVIDIRNPLSKKDYNKKVVAYMGIAVYSSEILKFIPEGVSSITSAWLAAIKKGFKIKALDFTGCYWKDIGSPHSYASAVIDALRTNGETIYINPSVKICSNVELDGYNSIEKGSNLKEKSFFRNCILLQGSNPSSGRYENSIIGNNFIINLNEEELFKDIKEKGLILVGTGGSDRRYYRLKNKKESLIIVRYLKEDSDFERHLNYTEFFRRYDIPVPRLIHVNLLNKTALLEDLGDISLYNWLKFKGKAHIEAMYQKVLDILIKIHHIPVTALKECPMRIFDYGHFRWETEYFLERFLKDLKGINAKVSSLEDELHRLALNADSFLKTIVHRDFQSQNIMIKEDKPRLIDYQGARIGPPAYDVASILWDPYYRLESKTRQRLLRYYIERIRYGLDEKDFLRSLSLCLIQRHMQALGAYGFLSVVKGKRFFAKFIPECLSYLKEEITIMKDEYPSLYGLILRIA